MPITRRGKKKAYKVGKKSGRKYQRLNFYWLLF